MKTLAVFLCAVVVTGGVLVALAYGLDEMSGAREWRDRCKAANGMIVRGLSGYACIKAERIDLK